jgi:hypothetical protein
MNKKENSFDMLREEPNVIEAYKAMMFFSSRRRRNPKRMQFKDARSLAERVQSVQPC